MVGGAPQLLVQWTASLVRRTSAALRPGWQRVSGLGATGTSNPTNFECTYKPVITH